MAIGTQPEAVHQLKFQVYRTTSTAQSRATVDASHLAIESIKLHSRPPGFPQSFSELGINGIIGSDRTGIRPLRYEHHGCPVSLTLQLNQLLDMPAASLGRRIWKFSHRLLHQTHRLDLNPHGTLRKVQPEIETAVPHLDLGSKIDVTGKPGQCIGLASASPTKRLANTGNTETQMRPCLYQHQRVIGLSLCTWDCE